MPAISFLGTENADSFVGTDANDSFKPLAGNDIVNGGAGIDTVVYPGTRSLYTFTKVSGGYISINGTSTGEGTDRVTNVERLQFADGNYAFDIEGHAGQAYRLYQAAFNRKPDAAGVGFQIKALDDGWGILDIAKDFIASPEFQKTYGNLSNEQFVTMLYKNVLRRGPDAGGFAFHVDTLEQGRSRAEVLVGFSESIENQWFLDQNFNEEANFVPLSAGFSYAPFDPIFS